MAKVKIRKIEFSPIKRFFYTYRQILTIAYKANSRLLILVTLTNSIWGLTNLPILYINKQLIDIVIDSLGTSNLNESLKVIILLAGGRAFIEFFRSSLSSFNRAFSNSLTQEINASLELLGAAKLNNLDVPTIEDPKFQDKYKKIEREGNDRLWRMIGPLSDIPNALFTILSGIIPIFSFEPWLALLVTAVTFPDIFLSTRIAKREYKAIEELSSKWRLWGWISWHLVDSRQFYENRILGTPKYLLRKLSGVQREVIDADKKRRMYRSKLGALGSIPGYLLSFFLNVYFFALALLGRITLGSAQLLYSATNTLATGFSTLVNDGVSIYENYLFVTDLTWFLNLKTKFADGGKKAPLQLAEKIEFKNVWFKYPNSNAWVLKGINFSIGPKQNLALVGENGAGKTTLIKLLCGLYQPTKGEILIDGVNVLDYEKNSYWKLLGVLFQDFSQYPFSARESIAIGNTEKILKSEDIKKAAKLTGIDEFIESLPLGYSTPLAKEFEKGVDPSKGQWQRIALARVLFKDAGVIVLDEPTSNVDPKAEEEIFEKVIDLARDKVLILISHRFSTVRKADLILNIDDGKIVEQGTHEELMKKDSEYAHLFKLQAKGYQ